MRKIDAQEPTGAEYEKWRKKVVAKLQQHLDDWKAGKSPKVDDKLYKESRAIFLNALFHGKCAYCEAPIGVTAANPHVEHYRPKNKVTERDETTGKRSAIEKSKHPGYFWLAYEWHNLLLSCPSCNTDHEWEDEQRNITKHPGKKNEFRVKGARVNTPDADLLNFQQWLDENLPKWLDELKTEDALLLHPYFDDPAEHLEFEEATACLHGKTDKGRETVAICDLNRFPLMRERRNAVLVLIKRFNDLQDGKPPAKLVYENEPYFAWLKFCARQRYERIKQQMAELAD